MARSQDSLQIESFPRLAAYCRLAQPWNKSAHCSQQGGTILSRIRLMAKLNPLIDSEVDMVYERDSVERVMDRLSVAA